jgi:hypothetical protein
MPHLSQIIQEFSAQIANLRASESEVIRRLTEIRSKLSELEVKRAGIMNSSGVPIYSLPDDVFLHVVEIGLELDRDSNDPDSLHHEPFQSLVARVSRKWQMVVFSAPLLWARVRCRPSHPFALDRLEACLMRSQRCLLDITFNMFDVTDHSLPEVSNRVRGAVNMLVGHADRWQSFAVLAGSPSYLSHTLKALRRVQVPHLTHFTVNRQFDEELRPIPSNFGIFTGGAPSLFSVSFHDCDELISYLPNPKLITNLNLSYLDDMAIWLELRRTLLTLPSLTHLSIPHITENSRELLMSIELVSVLTLEISCPSILDLPSTFAYKLFTTIATPSLDTLILNLFRPSDFLDLVDLSRDRPISLRYPALRSLEIRWGPLIEPPIIKEFVHAFPSITHLTMWSDKHSGQLEFVMRHLTGDGEPSSGWGAHWPHLQSVTIQSPFATDLDAVSAMISARKNVGIPISRLILERVAWKWRRSEGQPAEARKAPSSKYLEQIKALRKMVDLEVRTGRTVFQGIDGMLDRYVCRLRN